MLKSNAHKAKQPAKKIETEWRPENTNGHGKSGCECRPTPESSDKQQIPQELIATGQDDRGTQGEDAESKGHNRQSDIVLVSTRVAPCSGATLKIRLFKHKHSSA